MKPSEFKLTIGHEMYHVNIKLHFKSKGWWYEIEDFAYYPKFSIELDDQNKWIQSSGTIAVNPLTITEIGDQLESNFRHSF